MPHQVGDFKFYLFICFQKILLKKYYYYFSGICTIVKSQTIFKWPCVEFNFFAKDVPRIVYEDRCMKILYEFVIVEHNSNFSAHPILRHKSSILAHPMLRKPCPKLRYNFGSLLLGTPIRYREHGWECS